MPRARRRGRSAGPAKAVALKKPSTKKEDPNKDWVVERILDKRIVKTKKGSHAEYLLKWEGFPEDESTWEPEDNLSCPKLVDEFERDHANGLEPATSEAEEEVEEPTQESTSSRSQSRSRARGGGDSTVRTSPKKRASPSKKKSPTKRKKRGG